MSGAAGASAAAAAAAARRRREEEEEEMTDYTGEDLSAGWEFKILRSSTGLFRKPEALRRVLAEEARAGWVLLEKFDSVRIRLKRPHTAREGDGRLDFDAYRTRLGMPDWLLGLLIVLGVFGGLGVIFLVVLVMVRLAR